MILYGWWHNAYSQSEAGLEQYSYISKGSFRVNPILWYQFKSGWYAEGRYNYEADNTLSVYVGRTFQKESTISYAISTLAGIVAGQFNGGAIATNTDLQYRNFFLYLQSQYAFSIKDKGENYLYNWVDLGCNATPWLAVGLSMQLTNGYKTKAIVEKGFFITPSYGKWSFPIYIYNPGSAEVYNVVGINYAWRFKGKKTPTVDD